MRPTALPIERRHVEIVGRGRRRQRPNRCALARDDEDDAPGPPDYPVTRPGDLWLLGDHRLVCGDATAADDVARLLDGVKPHLMVTDPPYGVDYDPAWRTRRA